MYTYSFLIFSLPWFFSWSCSVPFSEVASNYSVPIPPAFQTFDASHQLVWIPDPKIPEWNEIMELLE